MKRILIVCLLVLFGSGSLSAQDRVDQPGTMLSYKSREIKKALYWEQIDGKWKSRYNTEIRFQSGVQCDNFRSLFIGCIDTMRFLFIEYDKGEYLYPNLEMDWRYFRTICAGLLEEANYEALKAIAPGQQVSVVSHYTNESHKNAQYSFPGFMDMTRLLYSSARTLYNSYEKEYDTDAAAAYWQKEYPDKFMLAVLRTTSDGKDVIRFQVFPAYINMGEPVGMDKFYFEIPYDEYEKLFQADRKLTHK